MIVYLVTNTVTGKQYVGATTLKLKYRWKLHCSAAERKPKGLLHQDIRTYGTSKFIVGVLSVALNDQALDDLERFWIRELRTQSPNGYNLTGGGKAGFEVGPEICAKLSAAGMGRDPSPATREKLRIASTGRRSFLGRKHSPETIARMSASATGRVTPPETRAKLRASKLGKKLGPRKREQKVA